MKRIVSVNFITLIYLLLILLPSQISASSTPTPTPPISGEYLEITDLEGMKISHTRTDSTYGAIFLFSNLSGTVPAWGLMYDNENTFYDMYTGGGQVRLRSIILSGYSTQAGDNILLTYDGNQKKRVYLPEMTGYNELYIGLDGSSYYDQWFSQTAQAALPPTPSPTTTPSPSPTPEGYRTPSPSPTPTTTPGGYRTPSPPTSPTPTPQCYCCPDFYGDSVTLTEQSSVRRTGGGYYGPACCGLNQLTWWTTSTNADWVELLPEQGPNWIDYRIFVALGDTSSLSPGFHQAVISFTDSYCGFAGNVNVYYTKPTPIPTATQTPTPVHTSTPTSQYIHVSGNVTDFFTSDPISSNIYLKVTYMYPEVFPAPGGCYSGTGVSGEENPYCKMWVKADGYQEMEIGLHLLDDNYHLIDFELLPQHKYILTPTPNSSESMILTPSATPITEYIEVYGRVRDHSTSAPLQNATIYLDVTGSSGPQGFPTNTLGEFVGQNSTSLTHPLSCIWVSADGYQAMRIWLYLYSSEQTLIDFELFPAPPTPTPTPSLPGSPTLSPTATPTPSQPSSPTPSPTATGCAICDVTIRGHVNDSIDLSPIVDATVDLHGISDTSTTTNNSGYYSASVLTCWGYFPLEISVSADGYYSQSIWEDLDCDNTYYYDFNLIPKPPVFCDGGDYDGDGTVDIGIFRPLTGLWAIRGLSRVYFGADGDIPVSGDYTGDNTTEIGIFRGSTGLWAIRGLSRFYYGSLDDQPIPADYNGDGTVDGGIFRETASLWAIRGITRVWLGGTGDIPVPADYNNDNSTDIGFFRPLTGLWLVRNITRTYFGRLYDLPVQNDYDGDNICDLGIFRGASGLWAIRGVTRGYYGSLVDEPVPADYNGNTSTDIGIFRDSSGLWAIKGVSRFYFGSTGDLPVTR